MTESLSLYILGRHVKLLNKVQAEREQKDQSWRINDLLAGALNLPGMFLLNLPMLICQPGTARGYGLKARSKENLQRRNNRTMNWVISHLAVGNTGSLTLFKNKLKLAKMNGWKETRRP